MLKRVKQVFFAFTAKITDKDKKFIQCNLSSAESKLFWQMNLPDQYHALNVCYTALRLISDRSCRINQQKIIKCCLLHDIGKEKGDVSTIDKIIAVLLYKFVPNLAKTFQKQGKGNVLQNLRHALFIYDHHAQIGYQKLMANGQKEIAEIIMKHHDKQKNDDCMELLLLREADELN